MSSVTISEWYRRHITFYRLPRRHKKHLRNLYSRGLRFYVPSPSEAVGAVPPHVRPRFPTRIFDSAQRITLLVTSNPKRGFSRARFDLYFGMQPGFTVGDYIRALRASGLKGCQYAAQDVLWDSRQGFIRIEPLDQVKR